MKHAPLLATVLLACLPLLACSRQPAPSAPAGGDKGFIAQQVDRALDEARKELATKNIDINGVNIDVNGKHVRTGGSGLPKAEITPAGDLLIDGKAVAINDAQRRQLLAYRGQIVGIAEAGMAIGSQGAAIAGTAISGAIGAIFSSEQGRKDFEQRMEAEGKKIEAEAMKLCKLMPPLLASQQALAGSLPAFKPYATMTQEDVDDCGKKHQDEDDAADSDG